ncbi:hypothetical protein N7478_010505 [Penicillium angulare]|uniref:uncharacterized protein n=1 Tax=Penicillium angulare TaxID=116970 RepID=UPI002540C42C|nr:uncharacterized protein N7478_010505 [Penicillium angulare]KAJ5267697.1 hypothetical protein N7478_010505 [Penicillium angulare]
MSNIQWDPLTTCEMNIPSQESRTCCGRTIKGASCKSRITLSVVQRGHQKLMSLARRPLDLATLELCLRDIAKCFLCTSWHQSRQTDDVAQRWYQAAVRNSTPFSGTGRSHSPPIAHSSSRTSVVQTSELDPTVQLCTPNTPPHMPATSLPSPSMGSFVTAATLRSNNVPWNISPDHPAFLSCVTNIRAGVQGIELHSLGHSDGFTDIHCVFCLTEAEGNSRETVVLCCIQCGALSHLGCMEWWMKNRDRGFKKSCFACGNEGALKAFIRSSGALECGTGACASHATSETDPLPTHIARAVMPDPTA